MIDDLKKTVVLAVAFSLASSAASTLSTDLGKLDPSTNVDVIVQFKQTPGIALTQSALSQKVTSSGGILKTSLDLVKGGLYSIPASMLKGLAADPSVAYISPNRVVKGTLDYAATAVNAGIAYTYGWNGTGIGVAVIDSGITSEPDLKSGLTSRIVYSQSFVPGSTSTSDGFGHGTHVAGLVAGNGTSSTGSSYFKTFRGIAPQAKLINLRVLHNNGAGTDSAVIAAIQQAIALKAQYNIRVINLSLGRPVQESYQTDPLCQAVEAAWKAGIVVVVAAGNEGRNSSQGTNGYGTITSPGNDPYAITVGAMKTMGTARKVNLVNGANVVWGDNVVWGTGQTNVECTNIAIKGEQ